MYLGIIDIWRFKASFGARGIQGRKAGRIILPEGFIVNGATWLVGGNLKENQRSIRTGQVSMV
ncbi:MAG: hypothetical protein A3J83_05315 [Elusimicrobia bacterium RIFOXYA2_FULL_40_6]|nr:MAG: hypothetical protein A3J83_05315 [Elusimicrobia bacterium RIFOXYA2_FULL_40_6]